MVKGDPPYEIWVLMLADRWHTPPWVIEQNMTARWRDWINEELRGRSKT
jgi:hypothetical protein